MITLKSTKTLNNAKCIILPVFQKEDLKKVYNKILPKNLLDQFIEMQKHFSGSLSESFSSLFDKHILVLLGLGEKKDFSKNEIFRRGLSQVGKIAKNIKASQVTVICREKTPDTTKAALEGILLGSYIFDMYKNTPKTKNPLKEIALFGKIKQEEIDNTTAVIQAIYHSRDLINQSASNINPETLEKYIYKNLKSKSIKIQTLNEKELSKISANGIINVGKGSSIPPRLIKIEYKKGKKKEAPLTFVGKGVTFDSGGYNLKPTNHIEDMKIDMSGAATVIGLFHLLKEKIPDTHIIGYIPLVENLVSGNAYKPGDIITMHNKKTVEVLNTDAEGRLILADSLSIATGDKPRAIIDIATLTGASYYAVGQHYTPFLGNDRALIDELKKHSEKEDERIWELPLDRDYSKMMEGDISDLKNITEETKAGVITGALFLENFINAVPWIHFDIGASAYNEKPFFYNPHGATGVLIRTLWRFIEGK